MKRLLYVSLFFNLLFLVGAGLAVYRLGGWRYALLKLQRESAGLYHHRVEQFERLPEQAGAIVFVGDSQAAGAEWHEWFGDQPKVLNRGISGDYTAAVTDRIGEILRHKPLKIFLWVGVNDLVFGKKIPEIVGAYHKLVQKIRSESPETELYLLSLAPVNVDQRRSGTTNERIKSMNETIRQIAGDYALPFINLYDPLAAADGNLAEKFSEDGLHLNGLGYLVVKNELEPYVK